MPTIEEIDEALRNANAVPIEERGALWEAFVDRLLEERSEASG